MPIIRDETGVLRRACDYVDTKNAHLRVIFTPIHGNSINGAAKGQLVPIPSHSDESVMELLRRLGMRCDVRDSWFFSQCARRLAMLGDAFAKGQELGVTEKQIFDAGCFLFDSLTHFQGDPTLLSTISRVPFIPAHRPKGAKLNLASVFHFLSFPLSIPSRSILLTEPSLNIVCFNARPSSTQSEPPLRILISFSRSTNIYSNLYRQRCVPLSSARRVPLISSITAFMDALIHVRIMSDVGSFGYLSLCCCCLQVRVGSRAPFTRPCTVPGPPLPSRGAFKSPKGCRGPAVAPH